jgi:light-regulated signal transduction histidine kinase (bacteriophytochrome)
MAQSFWKVKNFSKSGFELKQHKHAFELKQHKHAHSACHGMGMGLEL